MTNPTQADLVKAWQPFMDRAERAYERSGGTLPYDDRLWRVERHNGLIYVVLRDYSDVMQHPVVAVYRIRGDNGKLRRMKRWPEEIETTWSRAAVERAVGLASGALATPN